MLDRLAISDVALVPAGEAAAQTGLLGYVSATLNGRLRVDGLALRRGADGRYLLSFPARRDRAGRDHPYLRPLGDDARRALERQVFNALGLREPAA